MLTIAQPLSLASLEHAPIPDSPRWTSGHSRWQPVRHADLAHAVLDGAKRRGLTPNHDAWALGRGGHDLVGTIQFDADERWPAEVVPSIALRHSNVGRHAVTLALGAVVGICTNGMLIGEVVVKHRHTSGIDLDALVAEGLTRFERSGRETHRFIDRLRRTPISPQTEAQLLVQSARDGLVPWSMLRQVDAAWKDAPSEDMAQRTAWGMYNAYTEAIKRRSARGQYNSLRGLGRLFSADNLGRFAH